MKREASYRHIIILILFLAQTCKIIQGQTGNQNIPFDLLQERVLLYTDREIYCAGESMFFSAFNLSNNNLRTTDWSKVLYVELITPEGKSVLQNKFRYDTTGASGRISIPDDIVTGNYYIRAYTKWMRNYSPYHYFYKIIKIINPYRAELLKPQNGSTVISENHSTDPLRDADLFIKSDKPAYQRREKVELTALFSDHYNNSSSFCISVIKNGTTKGISCHIPYAGNNQFQPDFIPETRSVTLTGKVISQKDSLPVPFFHISLSVFSSTNSTFGALTNKEGNFYFSLPELNGETEIYLSSMFPNGEPEPYILVDNDFCSKEVKLPFVQFSQNDYDQDLYNDLIFNAQITYKYQIADPEKQIRDSADMVPFYGSASQSVRFRDFISLPSIEDYFNEFIPNVVIRKRNKERYFQILGPFSDLYIFKPLVLVDYVAVNQVDWILSISPKKVDRIEVIDKPYILGDICYGGIIHIISAGRDFAGVNLPSSGQFFKFKMYESQDPFHPDMTENRRIPDLRNLLYWAPRVRLKSEQSQNHLFYTGDAPGEYIAIIRGVDKTGHEIYNWCKFIVQ